MRFGFFLLLAAVLLYACGAPYQIALPIKLGETGLKTRQVITIQVGGFYTVALAFFRDYRVGDKRAEQFFNDVVLSDSGEHPARVGISLTRKGAEVIAGDYTLIEPSGVVPVNVEGEVMSSNVRAIETLKLDPGEYILEYENLLLDEKLGLLDSYVLVFRDEPKP